MISSNYETAEFISRTYRYILKLNMSEFKVWLEVSRIRKKVEIGGIILNQNNGCLEENLKFVETWYNLMNS